MQRRSILFVYYKDWSQVEISYSFAPIEIIVNSVEVIRKFFLPCNLLVDVFELFARKTMLAIVKNYFWLTGIVM
jgi:hypothetical protein